MDTDKINQLVSLFNELEVQAFSNKREGRDGEIRYRVSLSAKAANGRRFINRDRIGNTADGKDIWGWIAGRAMKPKSEVA